MRQQRFVGLLSRLFDPKVPVLFLVGTLVLAVLGNGVYEASKNGLEAIVGSSPATPVYVAVIALTILIGIGASLWIIVARAPRQVLFVPTERLAEAYSGLILLPSINPKGPEESAIASHCRGDRLRHCWLVTSPQATAKAHHLEDLLRGRHVIPYLTTVEDAEQAPLAYAAVKVAIAQARRVLGDEPVILDITAGTKPMTAGAVLACLEEEIPIAYMVSKRTATGDPDPSVPAVAVKVELGGGQHHG